jgi:hypothetical protein
MPDGGNTLASGMIIPPRISEQAPASRCSRSAEAGAYHRRQPQGVPQRLPRTGRRDQSRRLEVHLVRAEAEPPSRCGSRPSDREGPYGILLTATQTVCTAMSEAIRAEGINYVADIPMGEQGLTRWRATEFPLGMAGTWWRAPMSQASTRRAATRRWVRTASDSPAVPMRRA